MAPRRKGATSPVGLESTALLAILGLILDACLRGLLLLADPSRRR